jgi:hypothetical protein
MAGWEKAKTRSGDDGIHAVSHGRWRKATERKGKGKEKKKG